MDYYNHADKLYSVMVMAEVDGDQAESYRYKEYGEQTVVDSSFAKLSVLSSSIGNWKRYTGQEHALPSSLSDPWYFFRARIYRADAGRFIQRDPLRYVDGANQYQYVRAAPLDLTDPLGLGVCNDGPDINIDRSVNQAYGKGDISCYLFAECDWGPAPLQTGGPAQGLLPPHETPCEVDHLEVCCGDPPSCSYWTETEMPGNDHECTASCGRNGPQLCCKKKSPPPPKPPHSCGSAGCKPPQYPHGAVPGVDVPEQEMTHKPDEPPPNPGPKPERDDGDSDGDGCDGDLVEPAGSGLPPGGSFGGGGG